MSVVGVRHHGQDTRKYSLSWCNHASAEGVNRALDDTGDTIGPTIAFMIGRAPQPSL